MLVFFKDVLKQGQKIWNDVKTKGLAYQYILLNGDYTKINLDWWLSMNTEEPLILEIKSEKINGRYLFFKIFCESKDKYRIYYIREGDGHLQYIGNVSLKEKCTVLEQSTIELRHPFYIPSQKISFLSNDFRLWYADTALYKSTLWNKESHYAIAKQYYDEYCEKQKRKEIGPITLFDCRRLINSEDYFVDMILNAFFANTKEEQFMDAFYPGFGGILPLYKPHSFSLYDYGMNQSFEYSMQQYQKELIKNYKHHAYLFTAAKGYMLWIWKTMYDSKNCKNIQILRKIKETFPSTKEEVFPATIPNYVKIVFINGITEYTENAPKVQLLRSLIRDDFYKYFSGRSIPKSFFTECGKLDNFAYSSDMIFLIRHKNKIVYSKI